MVAIVPVSHTIDAEIVSSYSSEGSLLAEFLAVRSLHTGRAYQTAITQFLTWSRLDAQDWLTIPSPHGFRLLSAYSAHLLTGKKLAANTIRQRIAAIRSFRNWGCRVGFGAPIPALDSLPPAQPYKDTSGPTQAKMMEILSLLKSPQDKVLWGLLFLLGLRRSEVVTINLADIDLSSGQLWIKGKGKRDKQALTIPDVLKVWIRTLLLNRYNSPETPLIQNRFGQRLTDNGLYRKVREWGNLVGVSLRPHKIRHSSITTVLDRVSGDLRKAAAFSRHSHINTLQHYDDNRRNYQGDMANLLAAGISVD